MTHQELYEHVMSWYRINKRDRLPWRKYINPYRIHVSEVMLQQTQVDRVVHFFDRWVQDFPDYSALASASLQDVYAHWKGLGYNSRAKRLWEAACFLQTKNDKEVVALLQQGKKISGVGPYTAGAIRIFASNEKIPLIETNIRRAYIHHLFNDKNNVSDNEILKEVAITLDYVKDPREWYWALMDYGSTLPKVLKYNPNKQSKHYTKQSKFEGSLRQLRAKILFFVTEQPQGCVLEQDVYSAFHQYDRDFVAEAFEALIKDGLITKKDGQLFL